MRRFSNIITMVSLAISFVLTAAPMAFAQANLGGVVSGRVTDPSGAVIANAHVTAQANSTNVISSVQSDKSGYYVLQLPSGVYTISATGVGFETSTQKDVTVIVGGGVTLDFQFRVGSVSTVVEVNADVTPLINPTSSSVSTSAENDLVSQIPVEVSGAMRSATSFLELVPGDNSNSLNGGYAGDVQTVVDGAAVSAVAFSSGGNGSAYGEAIPTFAVQEFQAIGTNGTAEYGRTSSGAFSYILKSGTNKFHGSAFEYLKNTNLDAKTYFASTVGPDHQNEFGFDLGGPIRHDKTFFYGYYDGFRYSSAANGTIYSLLTPAMKTGDFSAAGIPAIYNPSTGQQYSCNGVLNVICPNLLSAVSVALASNLPSPTLPGLSNNFVGTSYTLQNSNEYMVKINHTLNASSNIMVSGSWETTGVNGNCTFGLNLCGTYDPTHEIRSVIDWDKVLSSSLVNHFYFNYVMDAFKDITGNISTLGAGNNLNQSAGLAGVDGTGLATINVSPFTVGTGSGLNQITHQGVTLGDDLSWTHGSHQFKFGALAERFYTIGLQQNGGPLLKSFQYGDFTFSSAETQSPGNSKTGYAAASFMLGEVDTGIYAPEPAQAWVMPYLGIYAQDAWKIRPNLTFNYGLRWDYSSPVTARANNMSNFNPTLQNPGAGFLPGALQFAGTCPACAGTNSFAYRWVYGFGPRLGIAYNPKPNTVIHAGFGIMYDTNTQPAIFLDQQGFYTASVLSSTNSGITPAFNWNNGFPAGPPTPDLVSTFANGTATFYLPPNGMVEPMIENYNAGIQQKIWGGVVVEVSYVGTQGHRLYDGTLDMNQLNPVYLALGNALDVNVGSSQAIAAGVNAPYSGFTGTVAQALRPFPQYGEILMLNDPIAREHYNALQARVQKSLGQGISFLATYAYERAFTNYNSSYGAQNYYDVNAEMSPENHDIPQEFSAGYTYQLPIGAGKLKLGNRIADELLGGWETSGHVNFASGAPLSITTTLSLPGMGYGLGTSSTATLRPNIVPGVPLYGPTVARKSFNPRTDKYINTSAFTAPAPFSFGNSPYYNGSLRAYGTEAWDAAMLKNFKLRENYRLGFKAEFFNVLNLHNFGSPNTSIESTSFGTITTQTGTARNGQLSLTLSF